MKTAHLLAIATLAGAAFCSSCSGETDATDASDDSAVAAKTDDNSVVYETGTSASAKNDEARTSTHVISEPPNTASPDDEKYLTAKDAFKQKAQTESGGAITMSTFGKTDGYESELRGTKLYTLEWTSILYIQRPIWKSGNGIEGFWMTFAVIEEEPTGEYDKFGHEFKKYDSGPISMSGDCRMKQTDNGWRVIEWKIKKIWR